MFLIALSAGNAAAEVRDDDELEEWREAQWSLPATSKPGVLLNVDVGPTERNRFDVDRASVAVGSDGVVRYTMVVTSASGATSVTFEGLRCSTRERRVYAFGRPDGTWSKSTRERWDRVDARAINAYTLTLWKQYFCPNGSPARDSADAISALERGGHPATRNP